MKNIWNKIKNFKYKMISAFSLLTLAGLLFNWFEWGFLNYIMYACCLFLGGYTMVAIYHAAKNTWNDGDRVLAVVYSTLAIAMIGFIAYLVIFVA